jgi:gluconate 2-dehydrogenase gamma chain
MLDEGDRSRRDFLTAMAGGFGGAMLVAAWPQVVEAAEHAERAARSPGRQQFVNLTAAEAADIEAFASQIIPSDGTPGAKEAGVVYFVEHALGTFAKDQKESTKKAIAAVNAAAAKKWPGVTQFSKLTDAQQKELMTAMEKDKALRGPFNDLRGPTIVGTFCVPERGGNRDKVGFKILNFDDSHSFVPPFGYYDRA